MCLCEKEKERETGRHTDRHTGRDRQSGTEETERDALVNFFVREREGEGEFRECVAVIIMLLLGLVYDRLGPSLGHINKDMCILLIPSLVHVPERFHVCSTIHKDMCIATTRIHTYTLSQVGLFFLLYAGQCIIHYRLNVSIISLIYH